MRTEDLVKTPIEMPIFLDEPRRLTPLSAWHEHIPFAMFLVEELRPKTFVELGTHWGDSYCAFCQAVETLKLNARCFAVDTWKGDPHTGFYGSEVLEDLCAHHDPLYGGFSRLIQSTFDEALTHFADGTVELLHIDGCHTYEAAKHDFECWLPKLNRRGVVLFHDTNVRERQFGVWRFWSEVKQSYPHFEFMNGHGLGVLGVGKDQPRRMRDLYESSDEATAKTRAYFFHLGHRLVVRAQNEAEKENLRRQVTEKDHTIQTLSSDLQKSSQVTQILSSQVAEKDSAIQDLSSQVGQKDSEIQDLSSQLAQKDKMLRTLSSQVGQKDSEIQDLSSQLAQKEEMFRTLSSHVSQKESAVQDLRTSLAQRDEVARDLEATLSQIQSSHGWNVLQYYYRLRDKLLPEGSHRRNCIKFVWRVATRQPVSTPKLRLFSVANFRKYLSYCRLYGLKSATRLTFRRVQYPNPLSKIAEGLAIDLDHASSSPSVGAPAVPSADDQDSTGNSKKAPGHSLSAVSVSSEEKPTLMILTPDIIGKQKIGLAVRHWEIAHAMAKRGYQVTLVTPWKSDLDESLPFAFVPGATAADIEQLCCQHDAVLYQGSMIDEFPFLVKKARNLIVDLVCPLHLEDLEKGDVIFQRSFKLVQNWMNHGDFYICGNERQRDYWLGLLSSTGRILQPYRAGDKTLRNFIDVVPFGIPEERPQKNKKVIRGVIPGIEQDSIIFLWWGGIWDWMDPDTPITAAIAAHRENPAIRILFSNLRRPNGEITPAAKRSVELAQQLGGLNSAVLFNEHPIPYDKRGEYLLEVDYGIISQQSNLETRFAARTRALDYWWAELPILCGEGDEVSDFVYRHGIGLVVRGGVESWKEGILRCADPGFRDALKLKVSSVTDSLKWTNAIEPIDRFCANLQHRKLSN